MIDAIILLTLAAFAWIGWLVGMLKTRAQLWVRIGGPIGIIWLTWYFFVALCRSRPATLGDNLEAGQLTVLFMVLGVWALIARPMPDPAEQELNQEAKPR